MSPCIFRPSPLSGDGLIEFDLSGGGQRLRCAPPRLVSEFRGSVRQTRYAYEHAARGLAPGQRTGPFCPTV